MLRELNENEMEMVSGGHEGSHPTIKLKITVRGGNVIIGSEKTFQVGSSGGPKAGIEISGVDADHNGLPDGYTMEQIKMLINSMRQSLGLNGFDTTDYSKLYDSLYGTTGGGSGGEGSGGSNGGGSGDLVGNGSGGGSRRSLVTIEDLN